MGPLCAIRDEDATALQGPGGLHCRPTLVAVHPNVIVAVHSQSHREPLVAVNANVIVAVHSRSHRDPLVAVQLLTLVVGYGSTIGCISCSQSRHWPPMGHRSAPVAYAWHTGGLQYLVPEIDVCCGPPSACVGQVEHIIVQEACLPHSSWG